jgi:DNA-binding NarL/FixJ family response regulator
MPLAKALRQLLALYCLEINEGDHAGGSRPEVTVLARVRFRGVNYVLCRARQAFGRLSPRERQVTLLVMNGLGNKEVGSRLKISTATVQVYLQRIYTKLSVDSRSELYRTCYLETLI